MWPPLPSIFDFVEAGTSRGLQAYSMERGRAGGIAAADYDNDGDVDLFVPNGAGARNQLYRNRGDGRFEEIAGVVGLPADFRGSRGALWFDYNGDGLLDLLVTNDTPDSESFYRLYRQEEDGRFRDTTLESGLHTGFWSTPTHGFRTGPCAGDVNNDGYLDLYLTKYEGGSNLLINDGNGGFREHTLQGGVDVQNPQYQAMMADLDRDGWLDIYVLVDFGPNLLWLNRQDGTFKNVAPAANLDNDMNDMGLAMGDYDNDGDLDLYVTNIFRASKHNVLFRNDSRDGELRFTERARRGGCVRRRLGLGGRRSSMQTTTVG